MINASLISRIYQILHNILKEISEFSYDFRYQRVTNTKDIQKTYTKNIKEYTDYLTKYIKATPTTQWVLAMKQYWHLSGLEMRNICT